MSLYSPQTPVRTSVSSVTFGLHDASSIRSLSACEVTSSVAFDNLGNALPQGLYDARMGVTDTAPKSSPCVTCGLAYLQCPGHLGHVELTVPVYNPLTYPTLLQFLKTKCQCCHSFRVPEWELRLFEAKLSLIERGDSRRAEALDDEVAVLQSKARAGAAAVTVAEAAAAEASGSALPGAGELLSLLSSLIEPPPASPSLTSHERQLQRLATRAFLSRSGGHATRCQNCSGMSPGIRQDASNKIFRKPLARKSAN
ncbi:hypothetical protein TeGR_g1582, partial [Tetraparma gracilis]